MAASDSNETLQTLLNKATSPLNREDDWEYIMDFCDKVNVELDGVQTSTRLIVHKIQSPQEREALQALTVLEACVKNCGPGFHSELGKYRFLNELIKLVSPKYLGNKTSQKVQDKVISMLYTWSIALTDQVKIRDAYQMLKKQGVVTVDPKFNQSLISNMPPQQEDRDTLFTDEEKRKQLEKLLKSTKPEDLQAANRLIKSVVKEDEDKMEKLKKRNTTLEEVTNNVRLLNEMLTHFNSNESSISDMQMMKELYDSCQKLRPTLFRLASDTDDEESALMEILRANDDVSRVMQSYEKLVQPKLTSMTDRKADGADEPKKQEASKAEANSSNLLDLAGLNLNASAATSTNNSLINESFKSFSPPAQTNQPSNGLDDSLLLNFQSAPPVTSTNDVTNLFDDFIGSQVPTQQGGVPNYAAPPVQIPKLPSPPQPQSSKPAMFADIDVLSKDLMEKSLGSKVGTTFPESKTPSVKPTLNQMSKQSTVNVQNDTAAIFDLTPSTTTPFTITPTNPVQPQVFPTDTASTPPTNLSLPVASAPAPVANSSLNDVFVPLESIRPSTFPPITAYDNNGIRVMIHFAKDHAEPGRTDTLVSVVSILSTRTNPVQNIMFQAAAPKVMKVKLQPPSNTELPAFNPIFSSPPLTQVMVIGNPSKKDVKIRYKLDYRIDEQTSISDNGLISGFPPAEQWGKL